MSVNVYNFEDAHYTETTTEEELIRIQEMEEAELIGEGLSKSDIVFNEDDESVTLSDNAVMIIGDMLLEVRNTINSVLDLLGIGEVSDISEVINNN